MESGSETTMDKDERETVRQMLEAALRNLREEAPEGEPNSHSVQLFAERLPPSDRRSYEAPVILVVSGDLKARSQDPPTPGSANLDDTGEPGKANASVSDHSERKVSHPGLERFTIAEAAPLPRAPKACFMEPGRACVNSGACEMRGF